MKCSVEFLEQVAFSFEKSKIKPDIVPIAKGIGGFPLGAVLMNKKVASGMVPSPWFDFGGNSGYGRWKCSNGYSF